MSAELVVERIYPQPVGSVWAQLIDPETLAQWMAAEGFVPVIGRRFWFRMPRGPGFDGRVQAEVIELRDGERMRLWCSGGPIEGHVTFTLTPAGQGTRLRMVQTGFDKTEQRLLSGMILAFWNQGLEHRLPAAMAVGAGLGAAAGVGVSGLVVAAAGGVAAVVVLLLILAAGWYWLGTGGVAGPEASRAQAPDSPELARLTPAAVAGDAESSPITVDQNTNLPGVNTELVATADTHIWWAPDGLSLVGQWDPEGSAQARLSWFGAGSRDLTVGHSLSAAGVPGGPAAHPSWHRAGVVVFDARSPLGERRLYFAMPGGAAPTEMLSREAAPGALSWPAVRAEGEAMAFVQQRDHTWAVQIWDRVSDEVRDLVESSTPLTAPTWSRDGTRIAVRQGGPTPGVMEVSAASGDLGRFHPHVAGAPAYGWKDLLFHENRGSRWDLIATPMGAGSRRVLVSDVVASRDAPIALSPDGRYVAAIGRTHRDEVLLHDLRTGRGRRIKTQYEQLASVALTYREGRITMAASADGGGGLRRFVVIDLGDQSPR